MQWFTVKKFVSVTHDSSRLLPKKILKGPLELKAENLGSQYMK